MDNFGRTSGMTERILQARNQAVNSARQLAIRSPKIVPLTLPGADRLLAFAKLVVFWRKYGLNFVTAGLRHGGVPFSPLAGATIPAGCLLKAERRRFGLSGTISRDILFVCGCRSHQVLAVQ
jgi:hypothetical protein